MRRLLIYMVAALSIVGCFDEEEYNTTILFSSYEQLESGGDFVELEGTIGYVFDANTDSYEVLSYEDALAGIVTDSETSLTLAPIASAVSDGYQMELGVALPEVMLLVVDTQNEAYAYADYEVGLNLPNTYITLTFRPWKDSSFEQGDWIFIVPEAATTDEDEDEDEDEDGYVDGDENGDEDGDENEDEL